MGASGSADAFDQPARGVRRRREADLRVRYAQRAAEFGDQDRIFRAADGVRLVAEQGPAARDLVEQFDAILETRGVDEADGRAPLRQPLQRRKQCFCIKSRVRIADAASCGREASGVRVVEEIGDEGQVTGAARGCRQSASGGGGDQDRGAAPRRVWFRRVPAPA